MKTNEKPKAYRAEQPLTKQIRLDGGQKKPAAKNPSGGGGGKCTGNLGRNHGSSSKPILLGFTKKKKRKINVNCRFKFNFFRNASPSYIVCLFSLDNSRTDLWSQGNQLYTPLTELFVFFRAGENGKFTFEGVICLLR